MRYKIGDILQFKVVPQKLVQVTDIFDDEMYIILLDGEFINGKTPISKNIADQILIPHYRTTNMKTITDFLELDE